jgi:DNA polymerase I-like protein with 3'-5' exonuclease and polymerase domains
LKEARSIYTLYGDSVIDYKWAKRQGIEDIRRKFKNALNNSKNFPIQGLAAHIVNRAMIALAREFKKHNIDGWIALQVHDEVTAIVREDQAELAAKLMKACMENTTKISIPLVAEPLIADNWGEAK